MVNLDKEQKNIIIEGLIRAQEWEALVAVLKKMPVIEVVEILDGLEDDILLDVLGLFNNEEQGYIVSDFDREKQMKLFDMLDRKSFADIFTYMASDIRADLYQELDREKQLQLLPFLNKKTREDVTHLSSYDPETAGGIMSTDFATLLEDMTASQAIEKVRKDAPSNKMIYYLYVVDNQMKLKGFTTLKDLIMAEPDTKVKEFLQTDYAFAEVEEDRESVANKIEKYDLVAIPVINQLNQLAGIVRHDEAIDVIRAEQTEDMEKFMGILPATTEEEELNYIETKPVSHFRKRVVWVAILAVMGLLTGIVIHRFEDAIASLVILAFYMPMVADTGGNTGSQAATIVIRAMALGQVRIQQWFKILLKEARISILLGLVIGIITFGNVLLLTSLFNVPIPGELTLAFVGTGIAIALSLQVISSTLIGASLPLIVSRLGGDPAVAASPAITTLVDATGLLIYFSVATIMFF